LGLAGDRGDMMNAQYCCVHGKWLEISK
jgi:hypothetical protein